MRLDSGMSVLLETLTWELDRGDEFAVLAVDLEACSSQPKVHDLPFEGTRLFAALHGCILYSVAPDGLVVTSSLKS